MILAIIGAIALTAVIVGPWCYFAGVDDGIDMASDIPIERSVDEFPVEQYRKVAASLRGPIPTAPLNEHTTKVERLR